MLKVSFNINNIQNTMQRHCRRVQTVLRLEQNVLEDRDEIKKKVFRENHQNNYKRQYGFFFLSNYPIYVIQTNRAYNIGIKNIKKLLHMH